MLEEILDDFTLRGGGELSLNPTQTAHYRQLLSEFYDQIHTLTRQEIPEAVKAEREDIGKWFEQQSWDVNSGAYIIPKMVLKRYLFMRGKP